MLVNGNISYVVITLIC